MMVKRLENSSLEFFLWKLPNLILTFRETLFMVVYFWLLFLQTETLWSLCLNRQWGHLSQLGGLLHIMVFQSNNADGASCWVVKCLSPCGPSYFAALHADWRA